MYIFAFSTFPDNLPFDVTAPLLCARITVYNPMRYFQMTNPGKSFGVAGLGGLGNMAVKFRKAFGLKVTVISTSHTKESYSYSMPYFLHYCHCWHLLCFLYSILLQFS